MYNLKMTKINLYFFISILFCTFQAYGQDTLLLYTEKFDRSVELVVLSNSDDDIAKLNTWVGLSLLEDNLISFGGISYYIPRKHLFNIYYGMGARFDGVVFFAKSRKDYSLDQSVDAKQDGYQITRYIASIPSKKTRALGVHYGIGHNDFFRMDNVSASHLRLGLTFLRSKNGHWKLSSKYQERKGGKRSTISLDGLWYFNHFREFNLYSSSYSSISEFDKFNENDFMPFGFGLTWEGYVNFWSKKGHSGLKFLVGAGSGPFRSRSYYLQFGFGYNLSFL